MDIETLDYNRMDNVTGRKQVIERKYYFSGHQQESTNRGIFALKGKKKKK